MSTTNQLYDPDLEREIVAQCAFEAKAFEICLDAGLHAEHFNSPACGLIYSGIERLYRSGKGVDPTSLLLTLTDEERQRIGGRDTVVQLCSESVYVYGRELFAKARRVSEFFRLRRAWNGIAGVFSDPERAMRASEIANVLEVIAAEMMDQDDSELVPASVSVTRAEEKIARVAAGEEGYLIPSGFQAIDFFLGGFRRGELYGLAGHMKSGKTMLGLQIADNVARSGEGSLVISLEMSEQELAFRMAGWHDMAFADRVSAGRLDGEALRLWRSAKPFAFPAAENLYFATKTHGRIEAIEALVTRASRTAGVGFVLIDYLTLIQLPNSRDQHAVRLAQMTSRLKLLASRTNTAILVLSQYNRDAFERLGTHGDGDVTPRISDIYGSSGLEKDAYAILLLDTPWIPRREAPAQTARLHAALHRGGGTGDRELERSRIGAFYDFGGTPSAADLSGGVYRNGVHP